MDWMVWPG
jgi:hypothetical protein